MSYNETNGNDWRKIVADRLTERNKNETSVFSDLVHDYNRIYEENAHLRVKNLQLNLEYERILQNNITSNGGKIDDESTKKIHNLEEKLIAQQDELITLHKRKGDNVQLIVDLNNRISEYRTSLESVTKRLTEALLSNNSLKAEVSMLSNSNKGLIDINSNLSDEYTALQLTFNSLESKFQKMQIENKTLVENLLKYKSIEAENRNIEAEYFEQICTERMEEELADAALDHSNEIDPN